MEVNVLFCLSSNLRSIRLGPCEIPLAKEPWIGLTFLRFGMGLQNPANLDFTKILRRQSCRCATRYQGISHGSASIRIQAIHEDTWTQGDSSSDADQHSHSLNIHENPIGKLYSAIPSGQLDFAAL